MGSGRFTRRWSTSASADCRYVPCRFAAAFAFLTSALSFFIAIHDLCDGLVDRLGQDEWRQRQSHDVAHEHPRRAAADVVTPGGSKAKTAAAAALEECACETAKANACAEVDVAARRGRAVARDEQALAGANGRARGQDCTPEVLCLAVSFPR